jgi:homoaconitase/3-isopropylmalate dehydratase large subunit
MDRMCFIDRHFIHEVTSPVAFRFKRKRHLGFIPRAYFATADHNTPTINQHLPVEDPLSANQLRALEENSKEYGISHWGLGNKKMESFMSWVLKTELHYLALLLFAEITSTHGALCHCLDWYS